MRSIVGLRLLDPCLRPTTEGTNSPFLAGEGGSVGRDGELKIIGAARRIDPAFLDCDGIDKIIEGGAQVVDAVAADN